MRMPDIALSSTKGGAVSLAALTGRSVVFCYPRTGVPGEPLPEGWDAIPGARGCTPQACGFRDLAEDFRHQGARILAVSTQDTAFQREMAERLHLPFPVLSDAGLELTRQLSLPTFEAAGMTLLKRLTMVLDDGVVTHVLYPVFPPDRSAQEALAWIAAHPVTGGRS
ncbi:MAG: redoxin family protein [Rhizobiales bacterium]|nr:redoxin family protein [Hyphomicrobiales bacterium]